MTEPRCTDPVGCTSCAKVEEVDLELVWNDHHRQHDYPTQLPAVIAKGPPYDSDDGGSLHVVHVGP